MDKILRYKKPVFINKKAFTLIELLVVIAIVGVLAGLLMPTIAAVREQGKRVTCLNNLRQHGIAWHMYLEDHVDCLPPYGEPPQGKYVLESNFGGKKGVYESIQYKAEYRVLNKYLDIKDDQSPTVKVFCCPDDKYFDSKGNSYIINGYLFQYYPGSLPSKGRPLSTVRRPFDKICIEMDQLNIPGHGPDLGTEVPWQPKRPVMALFLDGHAGGPFVYITDFEIEFDHSNNKKVLTWANETLDWD